MNVNMLIVLTLLLGLMPYCAYGEKPFLSKENQTILRVEQEDWDITENDTQKAMTAIVDFLLHPEDYENPIIADTIDFKIEVKKILDNFENYKVQFWPRIENGMKIIYCNFFHFSNCPEWKTRPVIVSDGGYYFWKIQYNVDTNKCFNFLVNGEV